jgi:competence protein ComEC
MKLRRGWTILLPAVLLLFACQAPVAPRSPLSICFLNVGFGDATLIVTPERHAILVDGGDAGQGANRVGPLLDELHLRGLDHVFVTNYNPEHINGIPEVLASLGGEAAIAGHVYDPGGEAATDEFRRYAAAVGGKRRTLSLGRAVDIDGVRLECIAVNSRTEPNSTFLPDRPQARLKLRSEDDRSMVLKVTYDDFDLLLGSDIHGFLTRDFRDLESELAPVVHRVEIYKANNHASVSSSNRDFVAALNPTVTVISGADDGRELTNRHTVRRILDTGSKVYLTNQIQDVRIPPRRGKAVNGNIWVRVFDNYYTVNASDTFRFRW